MAYETRVGLEIRSDRAGVRSGHWATIVDFDSERDGKKPQYLILWPDGTTEVWLAEDLDCAYEFRKAQVSQ